jgi:hypothetical protein
VTFDRDLRRALRRQEPPADFSERVMAEIAKTTSAESRRGGSRKVAWIAMGLAASLLLAFGTVRYARLQEASRAERTRQEVVLALRVTTTTLNEIQMKLAEISANGGGGHDDAPAR